MPRKPAATTPAAPASPARQAIQARLDPVELAIVEAARASRNIPMSEFVRLAVMQYATAQPAPPTPRAPGLAAQVDMSRIEFHLKSQAQALNSMRSVVEQMSTKFDLQAARTEKASKTTERWFRLLLNALGLQPSK